MKSVLRGAFVACFLSFGAGVETYAANCSIGNWTANGEAVNVSDANVGTRKEKLGEIPFRSYFGPCGLLLPLGGAEASYLENTGPEGPSQEDAFNVRFYFFLNGVTQDLTFFEALDSGDNQVITAKYSATSKKVDVIFAGTPAKTVSVGPVGSGWNFLEIQWKNNDSESEQVIQASVGNAASTVGETVAELNTTLTVSKARLGKMNSNSLSGSISFDDYDSRRETPPGILLAGDANGDGQLRGADVTALISDLLNISTAAGIPDCNEDGEVRGADVTCLINRLLDN